MCSVPRLDIHPNRHALLDLNFNVWKGNFEVRFECIWNELKRKNDRNAEEFELQHDEFESFELR